MQIHTFFAPNYYPRFSCKMGKCRSACCEGWPVSISMKNYFKLLGVECSEELRHRLDCGVRVTDHPTEDEHARFEPRYDGTCPLHMHDGRCMLHKELGEGVLPDVCRLYPRGIRLGDGQYECSCSNSCEAVLELLMNQEGPITFERCQLSLDLPLVAERQMVFETLGAEQKIRAYLISIVQDRRMPLPMRLTCLGEVLDEMDLAFEKKDRSMLERILHEPRQLEQTGIETNEISEEHLRFGLEIAEQMIAVLDERSQSIRGCGEAALSYFGKGKDALAKYQSASRSFEETVPNWAQFYENMLVNHMFFSQFPFQDRPESMHSEYIALCAVYAIMRFLGVGSMAERREKDGLIDGMAAAFRLIDHTEFDRLASHMLQRLNCTSREQIRDLISL